MKENKDCKIIQDLLPNYIEKLTTEETNNYIEEHFKICENCKNMYEKMKNEIQLENKKTGKKISKREVNFFKKYKNKLRVLRIIILIIVLVFVISAGIKIYIVGDLYNKAEKIVKYTNYHREITSMSEGNFTKTEIWATENKIKMISKKFENDKIKIREIYGTKKGRMENSDIDAYIINEYTTIDGEKTAKLNREVQISVAPQNPFYVENKFQLFLFAIPSSVKSTTFNGKECYYITNYNGAYAMSADEGIYIDKETGLPISCVGYETEFTGSGVGRVPATEYKYEFNTVTEEEFVEPNISAYKVEK